MAKVTIIMHSVCKPLSENLHSTHAVTIYINIVLLYITLFCITAAVNKMIKEMIPNVRVSNDARELILNCCTG